jgi:hypothetical protein
MHMAITAQTSQASRLTVLQGGMPLQDAPEDRRAPLRLVREHAARSILVAGSDARRRNKLLAQLTARLPEGTIFQEATATWEVLEHAPSSRMVMLAGDVEGRSTESVMHLICNRHPQLPVLAFGEG